ncbi:MAG: glycosyltransferase [Propionibacteriales bacterium]|nr:glycosyltransferase [Propionibacteriales bacterium]
MSPSAPPSQLRGTTPRRRRSASGSPRVLLLITRNQRRGAESFACVLADELARRGMRTQVLGLARSEVSPALPVATLGSSALSPRTLWRLRRAVRDCDLVVACGSVTLPAAVLAGVATGRPVIYQNIGDPLYWASTPGRRIRVRALLGRMAAVAALTDEAARVLEARFGVPGRRIRVIRNARDMTRFRPATPAERSRARAQQGLPTGAPAVALVGALSPEKRVDVAISAVALLDSATQLLVAGDGPLRPALRSQADHEAPGRVRFLGQVEDLTGVLRAADAVVLTSDSEGVPGVLIEAGLCGLPVVSTDVGYVRDVVVPGRTGYLVPTGDPGAAAAALQRALADAPRLGAEARRHCAERFDLDHVSDEWAALIRAVLAGRWAR